MSLPEAFVKSEDYFEECVLFFKDYQYLYKFANTEILVRNILDLIQIEEVDKYDVFDEDFDLVSEADKNIFLKDFFLNLERLQTVYDEFKLDERLESQRVIEVPLSPKKKHEIIYLSKEIEMICKDNNCDTVVDFGSGLGYLDQRIYQNTKCNVLGLECNDSHYVGAKKRQNKYHSESIDHVKYIKHRINEGSHANIKEYLKDKFKNHKAFCITGLHACADLTIDAINIFLKMSDAKSLILMPCCYHKMRSDGDNFKNFPLSKCLKEIFLKFEGVEFMNVPLLRLAAQPQFDCTDLEDMTFNLLARAALELYANSKDCKLKRNKRKAVKVKTMHKDFDAYVYDASTNGYTIIKKQPCAKENTDQIDNGNIDFDKTELASIWREISQSSTFKKAAIFILLQNYMQPVIENLVLYDRLIYMKERGIRNCKYKRIFNEKVSPRCLALIGNKI